MSFRVTFFFLLIPLGFVAEAQSNQDSLIRIINSAKEDTTKVNALNDLAFSLRSANPDSAILVAGRSMQLARELGYEKGVASAHLRYGLSFTSKGNYFEALQQLFEAKTIYEKAGVKAGIAASLNAIGRVFNNLQDLDKALLYYKQASSLYKELNNAVLQSRIENNVGYIYKLKGEYDSARHFLNASLRQALVSGDSTDIYYQLYNLGSICLIQEQPDSAKQYLTKALRIARKERDNYLASLALIDLGTLFMSLAQTAKALEHYTMAHHLAKESGLKSERAVAAQNLSLVYERMNNISKAFDFLKEHKVLSDSLFNIENTQRIAQIEAEFNYKQAEQQRMADQQLLEAERLNELESVKWIRNSFIVGFLFMLVISYLLYKNFSRKQKANALLENLNAQIREQAQLLKASNDEIIAINNNLELAVEERTRQLQQQSEKLKLYIHSNSHVVRAPVARILALIEMYQTADAKDSDIRYINEGIYQSAKELDRVLYEINDHLNQV